MKYQIFFIRLYIDKTIRFTLVYNFSIQTLFENLYVFSIFCLLCAARAAKLSKRVCLEKIQTGVNLIVLSMYSLMKKIWYFIYLKYCKYKLYQLNLKVLKYLAKAFRHIYIQHEYYDFSQQTLVAFAAYYSVLKKLVKNGFLCSKIAGISIF